MRSNFQSALANLREWEGFASIDPDDPGQETQYGISRHYHPGMWVDGQPPSWQQAELFYLKLWISAGCDDLPPPMDWLHFDASVNPGPGAAKSFRMWSSEHKDPNRQAVEYAILRLRYYNKRAQERPMNLKYIVGWSDRTLDFLQRSVINKWDMEVL